jgi:hypothetical protein
LNGIENKEMEENLFSLRQKPGQYNENPNGIVTSEIGDPGHKPV